MGLFMVRWFNHHYSASCSSETSKIPPKHWTETCNPSIPLSLLSLLVRLDHFRFMPELEMTQNKLVTISARDWLAPQALKNTSICALILDLWLSYKQPVNTQTDLQLTHCWLGMATEVSTSAMAPNIWSVRPWFFCRAFILSPNGKQTLSSNYSPLLAWPPLSLLSPCFQSSFSSCLTAYCATVWSRATAARLVLAWHTQETSCIWIIDPGRGGQVSVWTGASELLVPLSPSPIQTQVSWLEVSLILEKISTLCSQFKLPLETQREDFLGPSWAAVLFFLIPLILTVWKYFSVRSFCLNAGTVSRAFKSRAHHPPWNPPFLFFIGSRGSPPPFPKPLLLPSFSPFFHFVLLVCFFPPNLNLFYISSFWSFFELPWHPTVFLHLCPSLRQWHMDCVNSWAAGQPQIRYEYTAHEAQLFKRLSPIAHTHTSYTTSLTAQVLISRTTVFVCGCLMTNVCH